MTSIRIALTVDDVFSVYSGKAGKCCCGCAGKHTYAAKTRTAAGKNRGYAIDDNEVSDRSVKLILDKMYNAAREGKASDVEMTANFVSVTVDGRLYVAYLKRS